MRTPPGPLCFLQVLHLRDLDIAQVLCLQHIGGGSEVLHLKDLHCTKIVQNRLVSARGNGLSHRPGLRANGARKCCRKDLGGLSGK